MKIIRPRKELRTYVRYYWTLETNQPFSVLTFPIGCPQMIFHRKSPLYIPETGTSQSRFTVSGQVNFPAHISSVGDTEMIVAVFYPHTISMFIHTPPSAFYNQEISGYDIENRSFSELADRVFECPDTPTAISLIEQWLASGIKHTPNIDRIGASLSTMLHSASASVETFASTACLGKKQFERLFRQYIGMNPKEYGRIVRFQRALRMLQLGFRNYADIAYSCGYSDQSHFIREFCQFSSLTPTMISNPYSDLFTVPV